MAQVTVSIHGRNYQVACEDGQEAHVRKLASYIDRSVTDIASKSGLPGPSGQIAEAHLLVMASLMIADELGDTYDRLEEVRKAPPKIVPDPVTVKAAEEARSAASAARVQLGEAENAMRNALSRAAAAEADAARARDELATQKARNGALEDAARVGTAASQEAATAVQAAQTQIAQAAAATQAAQTRAGELGAALQTAQGEIASLRNSVASLTAQLEAARSDDTEAVGALDTMSARIEAMAERIERAAAR